MNINQINSDLPEGMFAVAVTGQDLMNEIKKTSHWFKDSPIKPDEQYTLIYEVEGYEKKMTYKFSGKKILDELAAYLLQSSENEYAPNIYEMKSFGLTGTLLWSLINISEKEFKKAKKCHSSSSVRHISKVYRKTRKLTEHVEYAICVYLFAMSHAYEMKDGQNTLHILDQPTSPEVLDGLKETWQDSPLAKRGVVSSYEEIKSILENGCLIPNWT
jgi:hypothetical protein